MPAKNEAEVAIGGRVITLSGYESREYIQKVAAYLDNKLDEHKKMESYNRLPLEFQNIMIQLNIADEFLRLRIWRILLRVILRARTRKFMISSMSLSPAG